MSSYTGRRVKCHQLTYPELAVDDDGSGVRHIHSWQGVPHVQLGVICEDCIHPYQDGIMAGAQ